MISKPKKCCMINVRFKVCNCMEKVWFKVRLNKKCRFEALSGDIGMLQESDTLTG